jgi:hypothetical protein
MTAEGAAVAHRPRRRRGPRLEGTVLSPHCGDSAPIMLGGADLAYVARTHQQRDGNSNVSGVLTQILYDLVAAPCRIGLRSGHCARCRESPRTTHSGRSAGAALSTLPDYVLYFSDGCMFPGDRQSRGRHSLVSFRQPQAGKSVHHEPWSYEASPPIIHWQFSVSRSTSEVWPRRPQGVQSLIDPSRT